MVIPQGSVVNIFKDNNLLIDKNLHLEENITLTLSSQFSPVVSANADKLFGLLAGFTQEKFGWGSTGMFKQFGYQTWDKTDPISFRFSASLHMETNALYDVVLPAKKLLKLNLPEDLGLNANGKGGWGLKAPGPNIEAALRGNKADNLYYMTAGEIYLSPIIIKKVEPTFSREKDDQGYSIWIKLTFEIDTLFTATTNDIDNFFPRG